MCPPVGDRSAGSRGQLLCGIADKKIQRSIGGLDDSCGKFSNKGLDAMFPRLDRRREFWGCSPGEGLDVEEGLLPVEEEGEALEEGASGAVQMLELGRLCVRMRFSGFPSEGCCRWLVGASDKASKQFLVLWAFSCGPGSGGAAGPDLAGFGGLAGRGLWTCGPSLLVFLQLLGLSQEEAPPHWALLQGPEVSPQREVRVHEFSVLGADSVNDTMEFVKDSTKGVRGISIVGDTRGEATCAAIERTPPYRGVEPAGDLFVRGIARKSPIPDRSLDGCCSTPRKSARLACPQDLDAMDRAKFRKFRLREGAAVNHSLSPREDTRGSILEGVLLELGASTGNKISKMVQYVVFTSARRTFVASWTF